MVVDHHIQVPLAVGNDKIVPRQYFAPLTRFETGSPSSSRIAGKSKRHVDVVVVVSEDGKGER